ncbi:chromate efflux transporter [Pseudoduganella albidiflava]|uniref:Chromate efflux transporter n=1 Tax=Pseudoduganella albidiflava TaxID=321983 RepID=A0A411WTQ9_9BURK|nr:chromate efflux transporter [Pseudoduganella albidiflava]QBI00156.1 chromate efflux transporter [Pseudoduganella albidiflava]GGY66257.1 chromate transporter [Pseudoduganella albidiflava]
MTPPSPSLSTALRYWLKLGFISFGGPAGQIALMHAELVERRRWISEQRFLHALNYCMLLPGPEATQLAVYIGWLLHRARGGILAGTLFVLPSLLILIGLSWIYLAFGDVPAIAAVLYGIKPAVVALVLAATWRIGRRTLKNGLLAALACAAFAAIMLGVPFPAVVLVAAMLGWLGGRLRPAAFAPGMPGHGKAAASHGPAVIDDDTPTPPHARFGWRKLLATSAAGVALMGGSWLAVASATGLYNPLAQMGWFFTKAALLTFGGAYAVLPYVYQGGVETHGWLTPAQMIDGLALGETTPGPLIMVNAFVGFVGGWTHQVLGGPTASGVAGAVVAAWFTFVPSFIFILAGGPLVEATRGNIRMTAPLTAISAAVVGVIASLAVFFGEQVFLAGARPDWAAIAIATVAAWALLRWQTGPVKLLAACAMAGLVLHYANGINGLLNPG